MAKKFKVPLRKVIPLMLETTTDSPHYHRDRRRIERKLDKLTEDQQRRLDSEIGRVLKKFFFI